jgi:hypothetical protein
MALLMMVFALFELLPSLRKLTFSNRHLVIGGLLSGFFGGFSGHQGALRSAFLGVMIGKRFLKKVTMAAIQTLAGVFLLSISLFLGLGII